MASPEIKSVLRLIEALGTNIKTGKNAEGKAVAAPQESPHSFSQVPGKSVLTPSNPTLNIDESILNRLPDDAATAALQRGSASVLDQTVGTNSPLIDNSTFSKSAGGYIDPEQGDLSLLEQMLRNIPEGADPKEYLARANTATNYGQLTNIGRSNYVGTPLTNRYTRGGQIIPQDEIQPSIEDLKGQLLNFRTIGQGNDPVVRQSRQFGPTTTNPVVNTSRDVLMLQLMKLLRDPKLQSAMNAVETTRLRGDPTSPSNVVPRKVETRRFNEKGDVINDLPGQIESQRADVNTRTKPIDTKDVMPRRVPVKQTPRKEFTPNLLGEPDVEDPLTQAIGATFERVPEGPRKPLLEERSNLPEGTHSAFSPDEHASEIEALKAQRTQELKDMFNSLNAVPTKGKDAHQVRKIRAALMKYKQNFEAAAKTGDLEAMQAVKIDRSGIPR